MDGSAHVEVPAPPVPAEETAWSLALADLGGSALLLALGIGVLWRWGTSLVTRLLDGAAEDRKAAEDRHAKLAAAQADAIKEVGAGLHRVELAVIKSDEHNQAAINGLRQALDRHESRLDRVDGRLDAHGERISVLEHGRVARPDSRS